MSASVSAASELSSTTSTRLPRMRGRDGEQVGDDLRHAKLVDLDEQPAARDRNIQVVRALLEQRAGHLDALANDLVDLDRTFLELDLAASDARHVEQIVDQVHEVAN